MSHGIDPALAAAQSAQAPASGDTAAIDPLRKESDALLVSDPTNPHHALYRQAVKGLELLGPQRFKDRRELERVALAITLQAVAVGLGRIDRVAASDDGAGYFFVDEHAVDPALRGYVTHAQATQPPVQQRAEAQRALEQRGQQEQRQAEQVQRETQQARRPPEPPPRNL
jgi:hypothetical protein